MRPGDIPRLTQEVWNALLAYDFPGNVRELENALVHAIAISTDDTMTLDCLPSVIAKSENFDRATSESGKIIIDLIGDRPTMDELQRRYLSLTLSEVDGNRRRAASQLGLNRRTIQRLIARYGLLAPDDADSDLADEDE